jgi:hypothetical protein
MCFNLAIADQSQSGKSHLMRITALVYGEVAHPVVKKEGVLEALMKRWPQPSVPAGFLF